MTSSLKADLHVHSCFSDHPSEWFLQRLGAGESYTKPEWIYRTAKEKGMDLVTITDHNSIEGALILKEKYPEDVITGVESTTYFPEDGCKIHVLIYGLTEEGFQDIERIRNNIYDLRDYLKEKKLAHAVAHATYAINGKLTIEHLNKLILLFDMFEGINGGRHQINNVVWQRLLKSLTPGKIESLYHKYRLEPFSETPWIKGLIGGSDDHAGFFIGETFTEVRTAHPADFLKRLMNKEARPTGRHNDYKSLAFSIYKIAYEYSKAHNTKKLSDNLLHQVMTLLFEKSDLSLKNKFRLKRLQRLKKRNGNRIYALLFELIEHIRLHPDLSTQSRLDVTYNKIADISDEFFKILLSSLKKDLHGGDIVNVIKNVSASIPGIFLTVPFYSTLKHMNDSRDLLAGLSAEFSMPPLKTGRKIMVFADAVRTDGRLMDMIDDATGITGEDAEARTACVTCLDESDSRENMPANMMILPSIYSFTLPGLDEYDLKIPSILRSLEQIYHYEPDAIYILTQGPVGLLGLLAAKLLNIACTGIHRADFESLYQDVIGDESVSRIFDAGVRLFYTAMDRIQVSSRSAKNRLLMKGFDGEKISVLYDPVDPGPFQPVRGAGAVAG
jgi:hypothetical protein